MKDNSLFKKTYLLILFIFVFTSNILLIPSLPQVRASEQYPIILTETRSVTLNIKDTYRLKTANSLLLSPTFSSSDRKIAAVDSYGVITGKKAGTAIITVKVKKSKVTCKVTVKKTTITLNQTSLTLQKNKSYQLVASVSSKARASFKSNKSSVVEVDEKGKLLAKKPGEATITIKADQTTVRCKVTVSKTVLKLSHTSKSLFRKEKLQLKATASNQQKITYKSSKKSVATVSDTGLITGVKNGTATITVKAGSTIATCEVKVKVPKITAPSEVSMKVGETKILTYKISSGNQPSMTVNKSSLLMIDESGKMKAYKKGNVIVTIKEDGAKKTCMVVITE